ncbi:hypothetical protein [Pseudobacillus wudalianchiensis]|nr:hypothetical protein [Bacillus wudalianchiensis]
MKNNVGEVLQELQKKLAENEGVIEVNQDGYVYQATCTFNSPASEKEIRF